MDNVIELRGLTKFFRHRPVVHGVDLNIPRGSIFALLGENGAGKTTTMRMLCGLLQPDDGEARILGMECWRDAAALRYRVGYVPERPRLYDWMSVAQIGWFTSGFHRSGFLEHYLELCKRFALDSSAKLRTLSKGQYAKVTLALALAPKPDVLILDEPTSGLDLLVRRQFLSSMVDMAGEGATILISSHQVAEVERVCSHVGFMAGGKLLLACPLDEFREKVIRVRLRFEGDPPDPHNLGTVLYRNGIGRRWEAILRDPDRNAVQRLRGDPTIRDFEAEPLALEDAYCALLAGKEMP